MDLDVNLIVIVIIVSAYYLTRNPGAIEVYWQGGCASRLYSFTALTAIRETGQLCWMLPRNFGASIRHKGP